MRHYSIEQAALCHKLANRLYDDWIAFYDYTDQPPFDNLSYQSKKLWIERAAEAIEAVGELRSKKVIAMISPDAPWGIPA